MTSTTGVLSQSAKRYGLLVIGRAPAIPQMLGSVFRLQFCRRRKIAIHPPLRRADEFGTLGADFNSMVMELPEKEHVRRLRPARGRKSRAGNFEPRP